MESNGPLVHSLSAPSGATATLMSDRAESLVAMNVRITAGSSFDPPGRSGLAHLVEHMMFAGTRNHARGQHIRAVQAWGGLVNARTSADWTKYYHAVTPDLLPDLLDLERERFTETAAMMSESILDIERAVVTNERCQRMDNIAYGLAIETLVRELCAPSTGYHHLPVGIVSDVADATVSDCQEFQTQHYVGSRVKVAIAGRFDLAAIADSVLALLQAFPARSDADVASPPSMLPSYRRLVIEGPRKPKAYLGFHLPAENTWEFELARFVSLYLSRGASAPLPDRLVRQRNVASGVVAKTMGRASGPSIGIIELTPARHDDYEAAITALDDALAEILACELADSALERAKAIYRSSWLSDYDSLVRRTDALSLSMQLTGSADAYFEHDAKIQGITAADLKTGLEFWHSPDHRIELLCSR